jgi:hypothetical protein
MGNSSSSGIDARFDRIEQDLKRTKVEMEATKVELEATKQALADSKYVIPPRYQLNVRNSSVEILDDMHEPCGVGFFISLNKIVTAAHCLQKLTSVVGRCHDGNKNFQVNVRNEDLDFAVLSCLVPNSSYLEIASPPPQGCNRIGVSSFSIAIKDEYSSDAVVNIDEGFAVIAASLMKVSDRHIIYSSSLFDGDSGGALILSEDGKVFGLHLEGVNRAKEELQRGQFTLEDVAASVNAITCGFAQGYLGLRLDYIRQYLS